MNKPLQSLKKTAKNTILISGLILTTACGGLHQQAFESCGLADSYERSQANEFKHTFEACRESAIAGNITSQKNLAYMYHFGNNHVVVDEDEAEKWFKAAADQGNESAIYRLQRMGFDGYVNSQTADATDYRW